MCKPPGRGASFLQRTTAISIDSLPHTDHRSSRQPSWVGEDWSRQLRGKGRSGSALFDAFPASYRRRVICFAECEPSG